MFFSESSETLPINTKLKMNFTFLFEHGLITNGVGNDVDVYVNVIYDNGVDDLIAWLSNMSYRCIHFIEFNLAPLDMGPLT